MARASLISLTAAAASWRRALCRPARASSPNSRWSRCSTAPTHGRVSACASVAFVSSDRWRCRLKGCSSAAADRVTVHLNGFQQSLACTSCHYRSAAPADASCASAARHAQHKRTWSSTDCYVPAERVQRTLLRAERRRRLWTRSCLGHLPAHHLRAQSRSAWRVWSSMRTSAEPSRLRLLYQAAQSQHQLRQPRPPSQSRIRRQRPQPPKWPQHPSSVSSMIRNPNQ